MGQESQERVIGQKLTTNDGRQIELVSKREIWDSFSADTQAFIRAWGPDVRWVENITNNLYWRR